MVTQQVSCRAGIDPRCLGAFIPWDTLTGSLKCHPAVLTAEPMPPPQSLSTQANGRWASRTSLPPVIAVPGHPTAGAGHLRSGASPTCYRLALEAQGGLSDLFKSRQGVCGKAEISLGLLLLQLVLYLLGNASCPGLGETWALTLELGAGSAFPGISAACWPVTQMLLPAPLTVTSTINLELGPLH